MKKPPSSKTVFILSASSDIGRALMRRYLAGGATVVGTFRRVGALSEFAEHPRAHLLELDMERPEDFDRVRRYFRAHDLSWDMAIASNATMEPIGPFLTTDDAEWEKSITVNALRPCRLLKTIYPMRRPEKICTVVFFAGGGTNNPFSNYSAYCLSKILLIKMCELLDDEVSDLKSVILGPGYVRTKIHDETMRAGARAGDNLPKTKKFLDSDGTSTDDIYDCIEWCDAQERSVVGGRNLSVVHDLWRDGGERLSEQLAADANMYKLRRHGNG